ncbi:hypothetical protein PoHVEF18_005739 [Penicillium ochrochloron]
MPLRAKPKPDSSHAPVRLRKTDKLKGHLHSVFNKKEAKEPEPTPKKPEPTIHELPTSSDDDEELSDLDSADLGSEPESGSQKSKSRDSDSGKSSSQEPQTKHKADNEPATDAEPQSTSEEEVSDEDLDFKRPKKRILETYEEKKLGSGRGDNEEPFAMWSSQSSKRAKTSKYGSVASFSRTASFARSPATPDKSSPQTKSQTVKAKGKKADKKSTSDSQPDDEIIFSGEINSSCPKISISSPKFKFPPVIPASSNANSTLPASSFKDSLSMDLDVDGNESPLSTLTSPPSSPSEVEEPLESLCPMCKKEVDPELLKAFHAQPKQRVREQQKFCASHQQDTAEKEWESQGYPIIDWDTLDKRVQKHFPALEKLLVPDCSSYYRNILDTALKSGKAQNFRLTLAGDGLETMSCGYYGTKGSGKMLQLLTDRFAVKLRRLATSDHIVKQAGVVGYAQSVLVPELAVRLVKEDMGVNDDAARQILRESIALGEKLNPALDDEIEILEDLAEPFEDEV